MRFSAVLIIIIVSKCKTSELAGNTDYTTEEHSSSSTTTTSYDENCNKPDFLNLIATQNQTEVDISWDLIPKLNQCRYEYRVNVTQTQPSEDLDVFHKSTKVNTTSCHVDGIKPCSRYNFTVEVFEKDGYYVLMSYYGDFNTTVTLSEITIANMTAAIDNVWLKWKPSPYADLCLIQYLINATNLPFNVPYFRYQSGTQHRLKNLQSCSEYNVTITPSSIFQFNADNSNLSLTLAINTLPEAVSDVNIKISKVSTKIYWLPPYKQDCIKEYRVSTKKLHKITGNNYVIINEVLYCTEIKIEAIDKFNRSGLAITTSVPGSVENLDIKNIDSSSLEVFWEAPADPSCVTGYSARLLKGDEVENEVEVGVSPTSYKFENLKSCTSYTAKVAAIANRELGEYVSKSAETVEPADIEKVNFEIEENEFNISVSWQPPQNAAACALSYVLLVKDSAGDQIFSKTVTDTWYDIDTKEFVGCKDYTVSVQAFGESAESVPARESLNIPKETNPPICSVAEVNQTLALLNCTTDNFETNMCNIEEIFVNCEALDTENEGSWVVPNFNVTKDIEDDQNRLPIEIRIEDISQFTNYTCTAVITNSAGKSLESEAVKFLTEEGVPSAPKNLKIESVTNTTFVFKWDEPDEIPGFLQGYRVFIDLIGSEYFIPEDCPLRRESTYKDVGVNELMFSEALPKYHYSVYVRARTGTDYGEPSRTIPVKTNGGVPEGPRKTDFNVTQDDLVNYNVSVKTSWTYPCYTNGIMQHFRADILGRPIVDLNVENHSDQIIVAINNPPEELNYECTFKNLEPAFKYFITIASITEDDFESSPVEISFPSPEGLPEAANIKQISEVHGTSFLIEWEEPVRKNGELINYAVVIEDLGPLYWVPKSCPQHNQSNEYEVTPQNTNFRFTYGIPNYKYQAQVIAYTKVGPSKNNNQMKVETLEKRESEEVRNLNVNLDDKHKEEYQVIVDINFGHPCFTHGAVKEFTIILSGNRSNYPDHEEIFNITNNPQQENYQHYFTLLAEYTYVVSVQVVTDGFDSKPSEQTFQSPAGVPPVPNEDISLPVPLDESSASFSFSSDLFSDKQGEILYYSIIIGLLPNEEASTFGFWEGEKNSWPEVSNSSGSYEATPPLWQPFKDHSEQNCTFVLGDTSLSKMNKALQPKIIYTLKVRGFTKDGYRDSSTIKFEIPEETQLALILGIVFGIAGTILILGFIFMLWRKRKRWAMKKESIKSIPLTPMPVTIKEFSDYYNELQQNSDKLKQEYSLLLTKSNELILPSYDGLLPENKKKNRYTNIIPYDQTRVKLVDTNDNYSVTDYINASYIQGYSGNIEYIATQGPLENTCVDFWKMVIQENVSLIVMVAQFVEQNKDKCFKYFPDNHENTELENGIGIRCCTELNFKSYTVRTLLVQKDLEQWTVTHLQFTEWPDFGCPTGTEIMLEFCQLMREYAERNSDPVIIHCSAGVGRTGTLIALDIILQAISNKQDIDIFGTVLNLRRDRKNMVQTEKQYLYIHNCIKDALENPTPIKNGDIVKEPIYENLEEVKKENSEDISESQF